MKRISTAPLGRAAASALLAASLLALTPAVAEGQPQLTPPTVQGELKGKPILTTILLVVLAGVVVGAAAMPAKRGHQD